MLKIGDFSKLSRVSIRMLRYYDEIGLLKPAETDRFTDYRYYREDQLPVVCRITALRDMGFRLSEIGAVLAVYDDKQALERYLTALEGELSQQQEQLSQRMRLLDTARKRLRKEDAMEYNVTIRTLPERYAACCRMTIPFGFLWPLVRRRNGLFRTVGAAFLLSLCIELLQPLLPTARTADITDLICNTAGGLVGYLLYLPWKRTF